MKSSETMAATRARLIAEHEARKKQRLEEAYAKARSKMPAPTAKPPKLKTSYHQEQVTPEGNDRMLLGRSSAKELHRPRDPRLDNFKKGDLVQVSRIYLARQRKALFKKDEDTKGIYYGPATSGGMVYVDWFVSKPYERLHRQAVHVQYLEPLGTPR